jgi:hypothetical protein
MCEGVALMQLAAYMVQFWPFVSTEMNLLRFLDHVNISGGVYVVAANREV